MKHHLWVLWTDYFKPEHLEAYPDLHEKFWNATKLAGAAKKSEDPAQGQELLNAIDELAKIFWATKSWDARAQNHPRPGLTPRPLPFPDGWMRRRTGGAVGSLPVRTMTRPYEPDPTRPMKRTRRGGVGLAAPRHRLVSQFTSAECRPLPH